MSSRRSSVHKQLTQDQRRQSSDESKEERDVSGSLPSNTTNTTSSRSFTAPSKSSVSARASASASTESQEMLQDVEERAWRGTASRFLGYSYDKSIMLASNRVQNQVFSIADEDIDIRNLRTIKIQAIELTESAAKESLHRTFSMHSSFPIHKIFLNSGADARHAVLDSQDSRVIEYSFLHFKEAQAALRKIPTTHTTIVSSAFDYVFSGQMYVGYQINFRISIGEQSVDTDASSSAGIKVNLVGIGEFSVGASISGNRLIKTLSTAQIVQINVTINALGGYEAPDVSFQAKTLEDINRTLLHVEQHFNQSLPELNNRGFIIEGYKAAGHVKRYVPQLPQLPVVPPLQDNKDGESVAVPMAVESQMSTTKLLSQVLDLDSLANAILENMSDGEKKVFGDEISPSILLQRIQEIFPNVITQLRKPLSATDPVIVVMGETGTGKSTLIGYQLGYDLIWNEQDRLDYQDDTSLDRPIIGHSGNSQTKGGRLYSGHEIPFLYLDSAGILDSAGPEANLCNGIALSSIVRKIESQLSTIIIVLPSSTIIQTRASGFLELINQLRKCLQNPLNPDIWANMIFVINDQVPMRDRKGKQLSSDEIHQKLINSINGTIAALVEEGNQLLPDKGFLNWIEGNTYSTIEAELMKRGEKLAKEKSDKGRRLSEYLTKIRALTAILENPGNLIVANLSDSDTRQLISEAINRKNHFMIGHYFTPENFYQDSPRLKFNTLLCAVASYYNQLNIQAADCAARIDKIQQQKQKNSDEFKRKSALLQPTVMPEGAAEQIAAAITENKTEWRENKDALEETNERFNLEVGKRMRNGKRAEIATKEQKIAELTGSHAPILLDDPVRPKTPITPRSWWTWNDSWATEYDFEYGDKIPYLSVTPEGEGTFTELAGNSLSEGIYKAKYLPKWHNYASDRSAQLRVWVATKDHPTTQASIRELKEELNVLRAKETEYKTLIEGLTLKCTECKEEAARLNKLTATVKSAAASQEKLKNNIAILGAREDQLERALQTEKEKLGGISEMLTQYQPFFNLVTDIITEYRLKNELIPTEREILMRFLKATKNPPFSKFPASTSHKVSPPKAIPPRAAAASSQDVDDPGFAMFSSAGKQAAGSAKKQRSSVLGGGESTPFPKAPAHSQKQRSRRVVEEDEGDDGNVTSFSAVAGKQAAPPVHPAPSSTRKRPAPAAAEESRAGAGVVAQHPPKRARWR